VTKHSQSENTALPEEVRSMTITITYTGGGCMARATLHGREYSLDACRRHAETEHDVVERLERYVCRNAAMDAGWPVVSQDANGGFFFATRDSEGHTVRMDTDTAKIMIAAGSLYAARPLAEKLMRL
jgi:hypothetical protein